MQLFFLVLCIIGSVLAQSTLPGLEGPPFGWSCASDSLVPCDVSHSVCSSHTGVPGCRSGTLSYPSLACLNVASLEAVDEKYCSPYDKPVPSSCVENDKCEHRCRAKSTDYYDACDQPSTWACNSADSPACGWSCANASREVVCFDGSLLVDSALCTALPPDNNLGSKPVAFGVCDPFESAQVTVTSAFEASTGVITVDWTPVPALTAQPAVVIDFNQAAARALPLSSTPTCFTLKAGSSSPQSTPCLIEFYSPGQARLIMPLLSAEFSATKATINPHFEVATPEGAAAVVSFSLASRKLGSAASLSLEYGSRIAFPAAGSGPAARHLFHTMTYDSATGTATGWFLGDYASATSTTPVLSTSDVKITAVAITFDPSVTMSRTNTKCRLLAGTTIDVALEKDSAVYPGDYMFRVSPASETIVSPQVSALSVLCSGIAAKKLAAKPVTVEIFTKAATGDNAAATVYGMSKAVAAPTRESGFDTIVVTGPASENAKDIFFSRFNVLSYKTGTVYSAPGTEGVNAHQLVLHPDDAPLARLYQRSYASILSARPDSSQWGATMVMGHAGEAACTHSSGSGAAVPCGVICGTTTRVCAAHGLPVDPLLCLNPAWPSSVSRCETSAMELGSLRLRFLDGTLTVTAMATEMHTSTVITVELPAAFDNALAAVATCSTTAPLSSTEWCRMDSTPRTVALALPSHSGLFTHAARLAVTPSGSAACAGVSARAEVFLPDSANAAAVQRIPAGSVPFALNCADNVWANGDLVGESSVIAFALLTEVAANKVGTGSLYVAFKFNKDSLSPQEVRDLISSVPSVKLSGLGAAFDLSTATAARVYSGVDIDSPLWLLQEASPAVSASKSIGATATEATIQLQTPAIFGGANKLTIAVVLEGVTYQTDSTLMTFSPSLALIKSDKSLTLGTAGNILTLSKTLETPTAAANAKRVFTVTILTAPGRMIDVPALSKAMGLNDDEFASLQTSSDGSFFFSASVPAADLWAAAAAASRHVLAPILAKASAVQSGVLTSSTATSATVRVFAPKSWECVPLGGGAPVSCLAAPSTCDTDTIQQSLICGSATDATDPAFQACRDSPLPAAFDFCRNSAGFSALNISEAVSGANAGSLEVSYTYTYEGSVANIRPFYLVIEGAHSLGEIESCTTSNGKPVPCGLDSSGHLRLAVSHGLRELGEPIVVRPTHRTVRYEDFELTLFAQSSTGDDVADTPSTTTCSAREPVEKPATTSTEAGLAALGNGFATVWVKASTTDNDFNPSGKTLTEAVIRVSGGSFRLASVTKCVSAVGDHTISQSSVWPPASTMIVTPSSSPDFRIVLDAESDSAAVFFPLKGDAPFTSVYLACIGVALRSSDNDISIRAELATTGDNINTAYSLLPADGAVPAAFDPLAYRGDDQQLLFRLYHNDANSHRLSEESKPALIEQIRGADARLINVGIVSYPGFAAFSFGFSHQLPKFGDFLKGSNSGFYRPITEAVEQALSSEGVTDTTLTVSHGPLYNMERAWRCRSDPDSSPEPCEVRDRCGKSYSKPRVCVDFEGGRVTPLLLPHCSHLPEPVTTPTDITGCGPPFSSPSVSLAGPSSVALTFNLNLKNLVHELSNFVVRANLKGTTSPGLTCSSSSLSASVSCGHTAGGSGDNNVYARVSAAALEPDAVSDTDTWGKPTFTVLFHNIHFDSWTINGLRVDDIKVEMPDRLDPNALAGETSLVLDAFNTEQASVEYAVNTFQQSNAGTTGMMNLLVAAPPGSALFEEPITSMHLVLSDNAELDTSSCKAAVISAGDAALWPRDDPLSRVDVSTDDVQNVGVELSGFDSVANPAFVAVSCGVQAELPAFHVRIFFSAGGRHYTLPRAISTSSQLLTTHWPLVSTSISTSVKIVRLTPFTTSFTIAPLKTAHPNLVDFYMDEQDAHTGYFEFQIQAQMLPFAAMYAHPAALSHLVHSFVAIDDSFAGAVGTPFALPTDAGEWRCGSGGNSACVSSGCQSSFSEPIGCYVGSERVDDIKCRHSRRPVEWDVSQCGTLMCYGPDGETLVNCDDNKVCLEGCRDQKVQITPALTSRPGLAPVCVRGGQVVDAASFCPPTTVPFPDYASECSPRSQCSLHCTDAAGIAKSCSSEATWAACNATSCTAAGVQKRFTACAAPSESAEGSALEKVSAELCSHLAISPMTRECYHESCPSWACTPNGVGDFVSCRGDGGFATCPTKGCTDRNSVSRIAMCTKDGIFVDVSQCPPPHPVLSKGCPLVTTTCAVSYTNSACSRTSTGEVDPLLSNNCLPFGYSKTPYQIGFCANERDQPVTDDWCGDAAVLRPCTLPPCDSNVKFEWSSTPGACIDASNRCASIRPVTSKCFAVLGSERVEVSDTQCEASKRPAAFSACPANQVLKCSSSSTCKTEPAKHDNVLVPGLEMGVCECGDELFFGPSCNTPVDLTAISVSTVGDSITFSWSVNKVVESLSVRVTIAPEAEPSLAQTVFILPMAALSSRSYTFAEIAELVPPGLAKITFHMGKSSMSYVQDFKSKCIAEPSVYGCQNNGTCSTTGLCECSDGFSGSRCEISACDALHCHETNSVGCSDDDEPICTCVGDDDDLDLFADDHCRTPRECIDELTCANGGTNIGELDSDRNATCSCSCPSNFAGSFCEECVFEAPGACGHGTPQTGCSGCDCDKGFLGSFCSCRFVSATFTVTTSAVVLVSDKENPATRLFFRGLHIGVQHIVGDSVTAIDVSAVHMVANSLRVTTVLTLPSCNDFHPLDAAADEEIKTLRAAVKRLKAAFANGKLHESLPPGTELDNSVDLDVDDAHPCEDSDCEGHTSNSNSGLSSGAIAGIVVACIAVALIVAFVILTRFFGWLCFAKSNKSTSDTTNEVQMSTTTV